MVGRKSNIIRPEPRREGKQPAGRRGERKLHGFPLPQKIRGEKGFFFHPHKPMGRGKLGGGSDGGDAPPLRLKWEKKPKKTPK